LDAGCVGYLLKESVREELIYAIRTAHNGGRCFPTKVQQILTDSPAAVLTERELEVLGWIARGKDNKGIGKELEISSETVRVHAKRILSKLAASNRTQAVANAIRKGVLRS
jgi:DNA-binding NarL/FixJ family response regulator